MKHPIYQTSFLVFILFAFSTHTFAQADTKITSGIVSYQNGEYEKALGLLTTGLEDETQIKPKNISKAWYYTGKTLVALIASAQSQNNQELLSRYPNAPLDAVNAFMKVITRNDEAGGFIEKSRTELQGLVFPMLQGGLTAMNQGLYETAMKFLTAAAEIGQIALEQDMYTTYNLRGQVFLSMKDSTSAYKDFIQSIELFRKHPPAQPDLLVAYVYYRKALIERYQMNNINSALQSLDAGRLILVSEWSKIQANQSQIAENNMKEYTDQYDNALSDIRSFELDILLYAPDRYEEAIEKFEQALIENPDNYQLHIAYASLLEKTNKQKAEKIYLKAISINPNDILAHYNLGAFYVNQAIALIDLMNGDISDESYSKLKNEKIELFQKALPHMTKAHELAPTDIGILNALMSISMQLEMDDLFRDFKQKRDALNN